MAIRVKIRSVYHGWILPIAATAIKKLADKVQRRVATVRQAFQLVKNVFDVNAVLAVTRGIRCAISVIAGLNCWASNRISEGVAMSVGFAAAVWDHALSVRQIVG